MMGGERLDISVRNVSSTAAPKTCSLAWSLPLIDNSIMRCSKRGVKQYLSVPTVRPIQANDAATY